MVLDAQQKVLLSTLLGVLSVFLAWNDTLLQIAIRRRGRGNGVPQRIWDGPRNTNLRRLFEDSEALCHAELRMGRSLFHRLCDRLKGFGLTDSRYCFVEEQVAMFLWTVGHDIRNRNVVGRFFRSGQTVSHYFHRVLEAVLLLHNNYVRNVTAENSPLADSSTTHQWHEYFQDAVGAVDGTHFETNVPLVAQGRYRNRKGVVTQNVLVACTFDMRFTYVLVGWEGSAHDGRLLRDAVSRGGHKLTIPQGKYYLADAGFALVPGFLTPYRNERYHLNDQTHQPRNARELFNFRHFSLRTVVERAIGVLKMRFAYLRHRPYHDVRTHSKIILACCGIHNWLREFAPDEEFFEYNPEFAEEFPGGPLPNLADNGADNQDLNMQTCAVWTAHRDAMAGQMWNARH